METPKCQIAVNFTWKKQTLELCWNPERKGLMSWLNQDDRSCASKYVRQIGGKNYCWTFYALVVNNHGKTRRFPLATHQVIVVHDPNTNVKHATGTDTVTSWKYQVTHVRKTLATKVSKHFKAIYTSFLGSLSSGRLNHGKTWYARLNAAYLELVSSHGCITIPPATGYRWMPSQNLLASFRPRIPTPWDRKKVIAAPFSLLYVTLLRTILCMCTYIYNYIYIYTYTLIIIPRFIINQFTRKAPGLTRWRWSPGREEWSPEFGTAHRRPACAMHRGVVDWLIVQWTPGINVLFKDPDSWNMWKDDVFFFGLKWCARSLNDNS